MSTLQDEEGPLDERVANELIAATPETWKSAVLEVRGNPIVLGTSCDYRISSPDGRRETVEATGELRSAVRDVAQLFDRYGHHWVSARYEVRESEGGWKYTADFEYSASAVH